jgi:hypothetical protein
LTGYAGRRFNHKRRMIPLAVEGLGHLQNPARAIFHTKGAALASPLNDADLSSGRRLFLQIQGFSPELRRHYPMRAPFLHIFTSDELRYYKRTAGDYRKKFLSENRA